MSLIQKIKDQLKKELKPKTSSHSQFGAVEFGISEVPKIIEKRSTNWVLYGEDNLYPNKIAELKYGSPIHGAIIKSAADMIAGDGFLIDGAQTPEESVAKYNNLPVNVKATYDEFLKNTHGKLSIQKIKAKQSLDLKEHGAYCHEFIFKNDFTKIAAIKYVDVKNIRAGKMINDQVASYYYCRDWSQSHKKEFEPREIKAFDPKNKTDLNQIVYEKIGSLEYYGEPDWIQAVTWIQIDNQMGIYHLANIENGMNPSMSIKFYKLPESENEKQQILSDIRRAYVGAKKTGKHMVFFSEGKDLAPDINPVEASNLDKQLIHLSELCDKKILTGHKLTSPLLAGISISGQIGGNTEVDKSYNIYDKTRILPYRNMIDASYQSILDFNKVPIKIKTNSYNPYI